MTLTSSTIAKLDLAAVTEAAATRGNDFFPSKTGYDAAHRSEAFQVALRRSWRTYPGPSAAEIVLVPKFGGGTRPAADLAVPDRLLFDCLSSAIKGALPHGLVNLTLEGKARAAAEDALTAGEHGYVLVTDVVSFYEYLDRPRLISELLDLTGQDEVVEELATILAGWLPDGQGLPQGLQTTTVLGDVYLSIADRALTRRGIALVRWADDYRLPATTLIEANRLKVELETELRRLRLVISSGKTWTPTRERYATWIVGHRAERSSIDELIARILERGGGEYMGEAEATEDAEVEIDPVLEQSFDRATSDDTPWDASPEAFATSRRIQVSLRELGRTGSTLPLERLDRLLMRSPHLTRFVASYLRSRLLGGWEEDTLEAMASVIAEGAYPYPWQLGWLLHAAIPAKLALPSGVIQIAEQVLSSSQFPTFIRGRAAVLLGTEGRLPLGRDLASAFESVAASGRPDLVTAAMLMEDSPDRDAFLKSCSRDALLAAVIETDESRTLVEI